MPVSLQRFSRIARCILIASLLNLAFMHAAGAEPSPRNVIFIAVDDLRNWVGYGGDYAGTIHTPNIDALAAVSTRYLNAYVTVPQCVGSRTSVMMGLSPATHQITFTSWGIEPEYQLVYNNPAILSLPQVLSQAGYHTVVTGKVFNSPLASRWDESGPTPSVTGYNPFDPGPDNTYLNPGVLPDSEEHPDQTVADWAENFISSYTGTEPFFLAVGFYQPHVPWRVPQWAYDLYPLQDVVASEPIVGDLDDEPEVAVTYALTPFYFGLSQHELIGYAGKNQAYTQAYLASISHTDAMVGQVLNALAGSSFASNTDIILWSDHGFHLGEKFHWGKNTLWEQSVKVPLLVSSPGNANYPVGDVTMAVSLLDLAPTVLDLAGVAPFPQFEGVPLRNVAMHSPVEIYYNDGRAIVIDGHLKTIDYDLNIKQGRLDQARYDLSTDEEEQYNIWTPGGC